MLGWAEFSLAMLGFVAGHALPMRWRGTLIARLGRRGYLLGYSVMSLALLYWLILAAGRAPWCELWPQLGWMRWLVNLAMPLAIALAVLGGRFGLMAGFALWAGAHLIANGDLAHVVMFGVMLAYALWGLRGASWPKLCGRKAGLRLGAALMIWLALYLAHPVITGVSPAP